MFKRSASLVALNLWCLAFAAVAQLSPNEQLPAGSAQVKAAAACLSCHEARIIVQQRLSKTAWSKEMDKMIKWGAEVDLKDRDAMIDYFSGNFGPDQPPYAAPSSAREPQTGAKPKH
jgi:hypothetical protein